MGGATPGIHGGNQHDAGGIGDAGKRPGDGDPAVLHRLAQDFEDVLFEFGKLIQKEHPVMGQGDLARFRSVAAANQSDVGDGVVRGAEGTAGDESMLALQESHDAVDFGGLDRFLEQHGRQDGGYAARQHGLS
jgi:hypothetical protein